MEEKMPQVNLDKPGYRDEWSAMTFYGRFEHAVMTLLTGLIMITGLAALWCLVREVGQRLVLGVFDPLDYPTFQTVFGMIFTIVIAREFKRSLLVPVEHRFRCGAGAKHHPDRTFGHRAEFHHSRSG